MEQLVTSTLSKICLQKLSWPSDIERVTQGLQKIYVKKIWSVKLYIVVESKEKVRMWKNQANNKRSIGEKFRPGGRHTCARYKCIWLQLFKLHLSEKYNCSIEDKNGRALQRASCLPQNDMILLNDLTCKIEIQFFFSPKLNVETKRSVSVQQSIHWRWILMWKTHEKWCDFAVIYKSHGDSGWR